MIARALLALVVLVAPALALTRGGGDKATDCLAEWGGTPANHPARGPRDIVCTDGDTDCDTDPTPGVCGVSLQVCLNVADPALPTCTPADLDAYVVDNPQPDTNPLHDFDLQALEDGVQFLALPTTADQHDVCGPATPMSVPLALRARTGGGAWRNGKKKIRASLLGTAARDDDRMTIVCRPADGSTPCDGVTSTFDQIAKQIFVGASCARSTCHNVAQDVHDLSLSPDEAYANLVGVPAANLVAASQGLLRVAPGDPANSFLVRKIRGLLQPGEGDRMPRGLKPLPAVQIRVVEEWIAAGAPATGFVAPSGCR